MSALKLIFEAKDLKTIVSTDDPKLQLRPVAIPFAVPVPIVIGFAVAGIGLPGGDRSHWSVRAPRWSPGCIRGRESC